MASSRPLVGVRTPENPEKPTDYVVLPAIFTAPIRSDLVSYTFFQMANNRRIPYAVSKYAGHQTSAESWGTGRAVARIPRVSGGGTHRAGQGAFGNMCRGGRMFGPTKTWRRWHRKINVNQKRYAVASAVAASAIPSLVMARGHLIENVPEIPLVIDTKSIQNIDKTKRAVQLLKSFKASADVARVKGTRHIRAGIGKMRNRRYVQRRGPLIVYHEKGPLLKAFRNLPGVEFCSVNALNLLTLAPGGHVGRFIIWTKDAFEELDRIWGTYTKKSIKSDYTLPRPLLTNSDVKRIATSAEVQDVARAKRQQPTRVGLKKNPLSNLDVMTKLNPYEKSRRRAIVVHSRRREEEKKKILEAKARGEKIPEEEAAKEKRKTMKKKIKDAHKRWVRTLLS